MTRPTVARRQSIPQTTHPTVEWHPSTGVPRWILIVSIGAAFCVSSASHPPAATAVPSHSQDEISSERYQRGRQLLSEGRYREASEAFRQAQLASMPDSQSPPPSLLATRVSTEGELPAISDPSARERLSRWHLRESRIALDHDEHLQAVIHAERALALDPDNPQAREALHETRQRGWQREQGDVSEDGLIVLEEAASSEIGAGAVHEYLVTVGDVLEVRVWQDVKPLAKTPEATAPAAEEPEYRISAGDILEVFIWQQPDLSRDVIVRPDGRLSFPLIGDVEVAGMTLVQLDGVMTEKLKTYLRNPDVSLAVKRFSSPAAAPGGSRTSSFGEEVQPLSRDVSVRPDGRLSFPLVGEIDAAGMTLTRLDALLTERFTTYLRNPDVSLAIKQFGGTKTIVLGEVGGPGVYTPAGEGRILEVIAMAGGFTKNANKRNVMLMRGGLAAPEVIKLNLDRVLTKGLLEDNLALQPNDIIYVPKGAIASTLQFMEQFYPTISQILVGQGVAEGFGLNPVFWDQVRERPD